MANVGEVESIQEHLKLPGISGYEFKKAFAHYGDTVATAEKATQLVEQIDAVIEFVNSGQLPEGHAVVTTASSDVPLWAIPNEQHREWTRKNTSLPEHGDRVYRPDENGEYVLAGEVATGSSTQLFLGDRILKIDGELVIVNTDLRVGITPGSEIDIVDLLNDPLEGTLGGNHQKRFDIFLRAVNEVKNGAQVHRDMSWG